MTNRINRDIFLEENRMPAVSMNRVVIIVIVMKIKFVRARQGSATKLHLQRLISCGEEAVL